MLDKIHRGYIEGYYGKLLSFEDRQNLLARLQDLSMDSYLYAPKEDPRHRFDWRRPYEDSWCAAFSGFCAEAKQHDIRVLAGIAPGLDFDFADDNAEFAALQTKAGQLLTAGADAIVLMFDDISEDTSAFKKMHTTEGLLHARLANRLKDTLGCPLLLLPRLYADEIHGDHAAYADELAKHLDTEIAVISCGERIVAKTLNLLDRAGFIAQHLQHKIILWDNLYCNDYCPRRLFTGPWAGRRAIDPALLNGTGMPETDKLLLGLMAGQDRTSLLRTSGVPDAFSVVESCFWHPVFSEQPFVAPTLDLPAALSALDQLLWQWKTPLAREWYPFLFGLKQDLLLTNKQMPNERIAKTQTPILATYLNDPIEPTAAS